MPDLEYECGACGAHPVSQVAVLTQRMLVNNWRNIAVFWLRLGMVGGWVGGWVTLRPAGFFETRSTEAC